MDIRTHLEDYVMHAKNDIQIRNQLIIDYKPFIIKTISDKQSHLLPNHYEDLVSVGMSAFEEAIKDYDSDKGTFISFAKRIISLRGIDYYRKIKRIEKKEIPLDGTDDKTQWYQDKSALDEYEQNQINNERIEEIERYKIVLKEWGITLSDLVDHSPKNDSLKKQYMDLAKKIISNDLIMKNLLEVKRLPINFLLKNSSVNRRKIERGRIYIIAIVLIMHGDFSTLKNYLS